jgi:L-ribulokinase
VTEREFKVAASEQTSALGSAMLGALAAGSAAGGYDTIAAASMAMTHLKKESYRPDRGAKEVYDSLYAEYVRLHDYFGRGENPVMKTLKAIKAQVIRTK